MNHLLKKARAALCALALLIAFSNCEKEELGTLPTPQQEVESPFKIRTVSFSDIPKLTHYLESKMGRPINGLHSKDTLEGAIFDEDNVLEVIDTLNNTNYTFSFSFTYPNTPEHVFYNLIVGVDSLGNRKEPYILKYVADSLHIDAFRESGFDFSAFVGSMNVHPIGDFFQDPSLFQRDCTQHDQYGDPIPCQTVAVPILLQFVMAL